MSPWRGRWGTDPYSAVYADACPREEGSLALSGAEKVDEEPDAVLEREERRRWMEALDESWDADLA